MGPIKHDASYCNNRKPILCSTRALPQQLFFRGSGACGAMLGGDIERSPALAAFQPGLVIAAVEPGGKKNKIITASM